VFVVSSNEVLLCILSVAIKNIFGAVQVKVVCELSNGPISDHFE